MKKIYQMKTEIKKLGEIFEEEKEYDGDNFDNDVSDVDEEMMYNLDNAQEKLYEVISLLEDVADANNDQYARTYLIDHLKIMAGEGHGFLSDDFNIDKWKEQLQMGQ